MDAEIRLDIPIFDERVGELVSRHDDLSVEEGRAAELGEFDDGYEEEWAVEGVTMRFVVAPV